MGMGSPPETISDLSTPGLAAVVTPTPSEASSDYVMLAVNMSLAPEGIANEEMWGAQHQGPCAAIAAGRWPIHRHVMT